MTQELRGTAEDLKRKKKKRSTNKEEDHEPRGESRKAVKTNGHRQGRKGPCDVPPSKSESKEEKKQREKEKQKKRKKKSSLVECESDGSETGDTPEELDRKPETEVKIEEEEDTSKRKKRRRSDDGVLPVPGEEVFPQIESKKAKREAKKQKKLQEALAASENQDGPQERKRKPQKIEAQDEDTSKEKKRRRSEDEVLVDPEEPRIASKKAKREAKRQEKKKEAEQATAKTEQTTTSEDPAGTEPKEDTEDPTDGIPSFPADEADHAETPWEAYQHLAPLLSFVERRLHLAPGKLRIYDPYYCAGSVKRHLAAAGFPNVYNRNEDFYQAQRAGTVPDHDVVVTNPPYSGDHVPRFLQFAARNGKPWFLLVPNYVYMKDYYSATLRGRMPMYLTPPARYVYQSPKGVCNALGMKRKSGEHKTAPFQTFWFVRTEPAVSGREALQWWLQSGMSAKTGCKLCKDSTVLPHDMRDSFDPLRKRPPKHQRKAMKKTHTADGRPLCRECGQVHGNCKHTKA